MAWTQSGNIKGASGAPGASGAQGASGVPGTTGATGASGPAGPTISRSISTVTGTTTLGGAANTDYVLFSNINADASASSVVTLLSGDGASDSTTMTDSSNVAANWTAAGNAKLSTSVKKFGTASISFDGTNSRITASGASSNYGMGTGNFTIEMWLYFNSVTGGRVIFDGRPGSNGAYQTIYMGSSKINYYANTTFAIFSTTVIAVNTWYHVAVCRSGTSTRLFINGTQEGDTWTDNTNYVNVQPKIGANGLNNSEWFSGYVDDLRITKGVARYTSNFTAPTSGFLDSLPFITLPTAASNTNLYTVKNIHGTSAATVQTTSSQTIDGSASLSLTAGSMARLVSDGSNWRTV